MDPSRPRRTRASTQVFVALVLVVALLIGGVWILSQPTALVPTWREAILYDASKSATPTERCADARRIGETIAVESAGALRVVVFATGTRLTGNEPVRLGAIARERSTVLLEQTDDAAEREHFLDEIDRLCRAIEPNNESPIFPGLASVVKTFSKADCAPPNHCRVWTRTDGLDTADRALVDALKYGVSKGKHYAPRIDNTNVSIIICGVSERQLRKGEAAPPLATVEAAYRREFSHPELVHVQPTCLPFLVDRQHHDQPKEQHHGQ